MPRTRVHVAALGRGDATGPVSNRIFLVASARHELGVDVGVHQRHQALEVTWIEGDAVLDDRVLRRRLDQRVGGPAVTDAPPAGDATTLGGALRDRAGAAVVGASALVAARRALFLIRRRLDAVQLGDVGRHGVLAEGLGVLLRGRGPRAVPLVVEVVLLRRPIVTGHRHLAVTVERQLMHVVREVRIDVGRVVRGVPRVELAFALHADVFRLELIARCRAVVAASVTGASADEQSHDHPREVTYSHVRHFTCWSNDAQRWSLHSCGRMCVADDTCGRRCAVEPDSAGVRSLRE